MSKDKYPSNYPSKFSRQMKSIVYIYIFSKFLAQDNDFPAF